MNRFILLGSILAKAILAFPSQPGSCNSGVPLNSSHITSTQIGTGPIEDGGFTFSIGGNRLIPGKRFSATQSAGGDDGDVVRVTGALPFRGFLIRIAGEGVDATDFLIAGTESQELSLCLAQSAGGLGHVGNDQKDFVDGILQVPSPMNGLTVEVTVVVSNRDSVSEWYMSTYSVDILEAATFAPVTPAPMTPEPAFAAPSVPDTSAPISSLATSAPAPNSSLATPAPAPNSSSSAPAAATTATPVFGTWAPNDATTPFPTAPGSVTTAPGTAAPFSTGNIPFFNTSTSTPISPGSAFPSISLGPTSSFAPTVRESSVPTTSSPSASPGPTISSIPSVMPTMTRRPSSSFAPTTMGSASPTSTLGPTVSSGPTATTGPSAVPTVSLAPSTAKSEVPTTSVGPSLTFSPSTTTAPSIPPSTSPLPTASFAPTMVQSGAPTTTTHPSMVPSMTHAPSSSLSPTMVESSVPTSKTSMTNLTAPTPAPTKISIVDLTPANSIPSGSPDGRFSVCVLALGVLMMLCTM